LAATSRAVLTSASAPPSAAQRAKPGGASSALPQSFAERRLLRFAPAHVYGVVAAVEDYAAFVPWCVRSSVLARSPGGLESAQRKYSG
jgi:hypothetical protein